MQFSYLADKKPANYCTVYGPVEKTTQFKGAVNQHLAWYKSLVVYKTQTSRYMLQLASVPPWLPSNVDWSMTARKTTWPCCSQREWSSQKLTRIKGLFSQWWSLYVDAITTVWGAAMYVICVGEFWAAWDQIRAQKPCMFCICPIKINVLFNLLSVLTVALK